MAELTEDKLIALFEAAEDASEGMKKAAETMNTMAEAASKAIEVLSSFADSFGSITRMAASTADALNALSRRLLDIFDRELELEEAKFAGPKSGREHKAQLQAEDLSDQIQVEKTDRYDTLKENWKNRDGKYDLVLFTLDKETESEKEHAKRLEERNRAEVKYAEKRRALAKGDEQIAKAQAALEKARHKERLHNLQKAAEEEEKIHKRREQIVNSVGAAMTQAGEVMVDAMFAAVEGEKVNVAAMLETFLKGVAKKHTVLGLAEAAMAATSAATLNPVGVASHLTAMAMHFAVAGLSGGGAAISHAVAGPGHSHKEGSEQSVETSTRARRGRAEGNSGGGGSGGSGDGLEAQDVPVSHEQLRRDNASARPTGGAQITINNPHVYGAGGVKEFAARLRTELDRQDRSGRKPRL